MLSDPGLVKIDPGLSRRARPTTWDVGGTFTLRV